MSEDKKSFTNPEEFHAKLRALGETATTTETNNTQESEGKHDNNLSEESSAKELNNSEEATENVSDSDSEVPESTSEVKKENKYVPRSRLKQEAEKREALENQLMKEREDRIRYETQLQMLQRAHQEQNKVPELDLDHVDPLDAETHGVVSKEIRQLREEISKIKAQSEAQVEYSRYYNTAIAQESVFEKTHPDYKDALKHLGEVELYDAELEYGSKSDYKQKAVQKMQNIIKKAIDNGQIAPEILYNAAIRKGYKPPKSTNNVVPMTKGSSNIDTINANMKKSASVNSLGSGASMASNVHSFGTDKLLRDPNNRKSGIDPAKFHAALKKS